MLESKNSHLQILGQTAGNSFAIALYQQAIPAGFPSPAEDAMSEKLDLNQLLIKRPTATFFLRVTGHSMVGAGIHHNDILIVDRSLPPQNGKIVIAAVNGELTVKRLKQKGHKIQLVAENESFPPIEITSETHLHIWGVVTYVIHAV
jgi:DNA polymerase V